MAAGMFSGLKRLVVRGGPTDKDVHSGASSLIVVQTRWPTKSIQNPP